MPRTNTNLFRVIIRFYVKRIHLLPLGALPSGDVSDRVAYDVVQGPKGPQASNVTVLS